MLSDARNAEDANSHTTIKDMIIYLYEDIEYEPKSETIPIANPLQGDPNLRWLLSALSVMLVILVGVAAIAGITGLVLLSVN